MSPRARRTLIIAVVAQAAVSVVQFGLPAIGLEVQQKFDLGPAGFGAVFAAVGLGSAVASLTEPFPEPGTGPCPNPSAVLPFRSNVLAVVRAK